MRCFCSQGFVMVSSKGEVILSSLKAFSHPQKKKQNQQKQHSTKPTHTVEKFGPGNPIVIACFVNENKNKT